MSGTVVPYARGSDSPIRVAQQLGGTGADALLGVTTPEDFADIMLGARAARLAFTASVSLSGYDRGLLSTLGPALAGVSVPVYTRPFEAGGVAIDRYRSAMARFAPQTAQPEQQFAMHAFIYTDLFLRGLDLAGACPTRQGFISALRDLTDYDAGGLTEPIDLRGNLGKPVDCNAFVKVDPTGGSFQVTSAHFCADRGSD